MDAVVLPNKHATHSGRGLSLSRAALGRYFRYYLGRRLEGGEDERQIGRWDRCAGQKGRWKQNLIAKVVRDGAAFDTVSVSPVVRQVYNRPTSRPPNYRHKLTGAHLPRQTLLHWAYELSAADCAAGAKRVKTHGAYAVSGVKKGATEPGGSAEAAAAAAAAKVEAAAATKEREQRASRRE